jgi:predicted enzyme related to lactoylglutathione lyase
VAGDLTYFWIPSPDPDAGSAFYGGLFGWTLSPREQGDGYGITGTTVYGGIVGGREGTRPFLYFAADGVEDAAAAVHELGGHAGELAVFPEGASVECVYDDVEFGIFRPAGDGFVPVASDKPGDLAYFTVPVRDAAEARAFYAAILGWEYEHDDIDAPYHHVLNVLPPGGLFTEDDGSRPRSYFRVEDIEASLQRVRELGGEAGMPLESVTGFSANCLDDQGIEVSLWQPAPGY